jgi:plastocyanin
MNRTEATILQRRTAAMKVVLTGVTLAVALVAAQPALTKDLTVAQKNKEFSERELKIAPGDSITFMNHDEVTHNVYSATKGLEFELKTQPPGKSDTVKFDRTGTLMVECAIHPKMKLRVHIGQ